MKGLKSFWESLDKGVFGYGSPVALGVLRVILGGLSFLALLLQAPLFGDFYTEHGLYPTEFAVRWSDGLLRFNPLVEMRSDGLTLVVFGLTMVAALLTCVGLFSRVATIALFLGVVALNHRSPDILNSGDTLIRQFLFFLAIGPSGAAVSLDRVLKLRKGLAPEVPADVSLWPQRLFQFQLAIVYFTTVWWKMMGTHWRDGTATWYPARLHEFDRFPYPPFIADVPMVYVSTYGTLLVELALATLVFAKPMRKWVLLAGVLMHGWIEYSMNIPFFSAIIVTGYLSFYDGEEVSGWFERLSAKIGRPNLFRWGHSPVESEVPSEVTDPAGASA